MNGNSCLFNRVDWYSFQRKRKEDILCEIQGIEGDRLLNTSVEDLCDYFEKKYRFDVAVLHKEHIEADSREKQIDVSQDPRRHIRDRSRPFYITGTCIEVTVPFSGDPQTFSIQPTSFTSNPPIGDVRSNLLFFSISGIDMESEQVRSQIDCNLASVESYLESLRNDAASFNQKIRQVAFGLVEQRREKLLADRNLVSSLGFSLKERDGKHKTFITPDVRRKITPVMPTAGKEPYKPEPALGMDDYEHILSVMVNMSSVMERNPSAFNNLSEDALRSHFLVQLNGHYEGNATGETFNYEGKTDILIRVDGKNIFIAECKYWAGKKKLADTIDQLLGYASWRDTKVAVIIFNRNKNFSRVLEAIPGAAKAHSNFKKELGPGTDCQFRYLFGHRDDINREMILTVLAFDVPKNSEEANSVARGV